LEFAIGANRTIDARFAEKHFSGMRSFSKYVTSPDCTRLKRGKRKMAQEFEGRTVDAEAPFLSGAFWKPGVLVRGVVSKIYVDKDQRTNYVLELESPVEIDGEEWDRVSIGNLAGFKMALQAMHMERLRVKDILEMECEDIKPAKKEGYSPRPNFRLKVVRP